MNKIKKVFGKKKNIVIGAIHLPPLFGYPNFPGYKISLENALKDLESFEQGGVDSVLFENNYDVPHKENVDDSVAEIMSKLGAEIIKKTKLPVGISVLWNDFKTALIIAKKLDLKFIRVPVFVDKVKTNYGIMKPKAKEVIKFRKKIGAENVLLFTDIHVKHSKILSKHSLTESAQLAIMAKSDALILTGQWTGNAPSLKKLKVLRRSTKDFPILIGSGVNYKNISNLFKYANGAIVSTSLKNNGAKDKVNIKAYSQRIERGKVKRLIRAYILPLHKFINILHSLRN